VLRLLAPRLSQDAAALPTGFVITFFVLNVTGLTLSAYVMLGYFVEQRWRDAQIGISRSATAVRLAAGPVRRQSDHLAYRYLPSAMGWHRFSGGAFGRCWALDGGFPC